MYNKAPKLRPDADVYMMLPDFALEDINLSISTLKIKSIYTSAQLPASHDSVLLSKARKA